MPTDLEATFGHVRVEAVALVAGTEAVFSSIDFLAWLFGILSLAISFLRWISWCHFGQLGEFSR